MASEVAGCDVTGVDEVSGADELVGADGVGVVEVVGDVSGSEPPSTLPPLCSVHTGA